MENTFTIEVKNSKTIDLLKKLEELNLIKFLKKEKKNNMKLSDKLRGSLTKEQAADLDAHIKKAREEW